MESIKTARYLYLTNGVHMLVTAPIIPDCQVPKLWSPDCQVPELWSPDCQVPELWSPDCQVPELWSPDCQGLVPY
jgi:hypothetical protein